MTTIVIAGCAVVAYLLLDLTLGCIDEAKARLDRVRGDL